MRRRELLTAALGIGTLGLPALAGAGRRRRGDGFTTIPYQPFDTVPFFAPGPELNANWHLLDPKIRPAVRAINKSGWVWTAESCQGRHPWSDRPEIRFVCRTADLGDLLVAVAQTQRPRGPGRRGTPVSIVRVKAPVGWSEARVFAPDVAFFERLAGNL